VGRRIASRSGLTHGGRSFSSARRLDADDAVPVIDCSSLFSSNDDHGYDAPHCTEELVSQVREACANWGFFQIVNHGIEPEIIRGFQDQTRAFFALPQHVKYGLRRSVDNSRGFFDDEFTKRKRDWKEGLDFGMTPLCRSKDAMDFTLEAAPDDDIRHSNLDGFNRFPSEEEAPGFKRAMWTYFVAMTNLAERLSEVMALGMGVDKSFFNEQLRHTHTSFLRLNYYPVLEKEEEGSRGPHHPKDGGAYNAPLGISPHSDAGFLTLLLQDDDCHSLQVFNRFNNEWQTVHPIPGALTVNTGDMAQVWSNDRYHAPVHRVLANAEKTRYSMPFFYNPGYNTEVKPIEHCVNSQENHPLAYDPVCWGYFRWQRYSGDFADFGREVQISDFSKTNEKLRQEERIRHQDKFMDTFDGGAKIQSAGT